MKKNKSQGVAIIGLGYVGLPLALLASRKGYSVIGIDLDKRKVAAINAKESLLSDAAIAKQLKKSSLTATDDFDVLENVETIIVCVPTPVDEKHHPDLRAIEGASSAIAKNLKRGQLIILESTVNPGVCDEIVIPILEKSGLTAGKDFYVAHCPERINPGDSKWNVENIPRVVGGLNKESLKRAAKFYRSIINAPVKEMGSLKEAEAVKIVENSFRDVNIAFVNELAMSFAKLGIDVVNVIDGAATKPFAFMPHYPGAGVGGHCIPVDPYYLIDYAKKNGFHHELMKISRHVNEGMPQFTVKILEKALKAKGKKLKGSKIAVLGISYKPNVGDCRESPSLKIIGLLQKKGVIVHAYDPYVPEKSNVANLNAALSGADAAIIATAHREFSTLMPKDFLKNNVPIVIDGRNCLPKDNFRKAGMTYWGIGR